MEAVEKPKTLLERLDPLIILGTISSHAANFTFGGMNGYHMAQGGESVGQFKFSFPATVLTTGYLYYTGAYHERRAEEKVEDIGIGATLGALFSVVEYGASWLIGYASGKLNQ